MSSNKGREAKRQRYFSAIKRMQSGVAFEMAEAIDQSATTPKHLRVGVNSALVHEGALADLLMRKMLITEDEYLEAIAVAMEQEVERMEASLSHTMGYKVVLGEAGMEGIDPEWPK